jgi:hypothetical protein
MASSKSHIPSLLLSLLFVVAAILFLSVALAMGVAAFSSVITGEIIQAQQTILLVVSIFEALILFAAAFISIQRFRQKPFAEQNTSFSPTAWQAAVCLVLAAVVILIGYKIDENGSLNWLLLPMLTLPAVALPIFLALGLATRRIPLGERWRSWSIFGVAMTLVPFVLIFLEIIGLIVILIFAGAILLTQPDFVSEMQQLSRQIYILGPDSKAVQDLLIPYIANPGILAVALFYFALLVPMMEELLKPLGVWLFAGRLDSPAQGFALGAISGAAYALVETLGVSVQAVDWASLLLSRIGTGILHVTSSALMGAAIVFAIRQRRYLRFLAIYLLSVALHGFWNAAALLYGFSTVTETLGEGTFLEEIRTPLVIGLVVLAGIFLLILVQVNRRLRATLPASVPEDAIP